MILASRRKRMNNYITFWKDLFIYNFEILSQSEPAIINNLIYNNMTKMYNTEEDLTYNNNINFDYFIETFKDCNINVEKNSKYPNNLYLNDKNYEALKHNNHIKLLLPIKKENMKEDVVKLFNFLIENSIIHSSKISNSIRFDTITIRIVNENDLTKILDFISNFSFIEANPFAYSIDKIALIIEGESSYNAILTNYIRLYLKECCENNAIENINFDDFINFINTYYHKNLIEKSDINKIYKDFDITNDKTKIIYIYEITELFLHSIKEDFNIKSFINLFNKYNDSNYIKNLLNNYINDENYNDINIDDNLKYIIEQLTIKCNKEDALVQLDNYIKTKNINYITRFNGIRKYVLDNSIIQKLSRYSDNFNIYDYFNNRLKEQYLISAIKDTIDKFERKYQEGLYVYSGLEHVSLALQEILNNHDYKGITNVNNRREELISNVSPKELQSILEKETNMNILDVVAICDRYVELINKKMS